MQQGPPSVFNSDLQPQQDIFGSTTNESGGKRKAVDEQEAPAKKVYRQIGLGSFVQNAPPKQFVCPQKKCRQQ